MINIAVSTNAFSKNKKLVNELKKLTPNIELNTTGRYTKEELINTLSKADAAIIGLDKIDEQILKNCKNLKIISKFGVGLDNIDIDACNKYNIKLGWTSGVNKTSVAEMTLGFMLMLIRNLYVTSNQLKTSNWNKAGGFQLSGKTIGLIGVGNIGKEVIRLLKPFNCKILVNDIIDQKEYYLENNLEEVSKEELYERSDIISIHTPFTKSTSNLITLDTFKVMKESAYIINTARGGIINESDLKYALKNKLIAGAAIDAYLIEPPKDEELISLPNLVATPHIGGNAKEAVELMGLSAINHLVEYFKEN